MARKRPGGLRFRLLFQAAPLATVILTLQAVALISASQAFCAESDAAGLSLRLPAPVAAGVETPGEPHESRTGAGVLVPVPPTGSVASTPEGSPTDHAPREPGAAREAPAGPDAGREADQTGLQLASPHSAVLRWENALARMTISPLVIRPTAEVIPEGRLPEESEPAFPLVSREDLQAVEALEAKGGNASPTEPAPGGALGTGPERAAFDVPIVLNEKVKAFLTYFQTAKRTVLTRAIERARRYLPMMQEIFQAKELPLDLLNLAFVESAFNPFATSRARASGIWQFMESTGRLYGMRSDWWHDERRDPVKATVGAAAYLKTLFGMFNSWPLAIAAYNAGEGKVQRAVERQRTTDFWALKLPRETQAFVPAFMAMTIIAKDPERHGFPPLDPEPIRTDQVTIRGPADLRVIARSAGTSLQEIRALNPEVIRLVTPPTRPSYELKLPYGTKAAFLEAFGGLPKNERVTWQRQAVRKGETFATIARRFRVPTGLLLEINGTTKAHSLKPGTTVAVPIPTLGKPGAPDPAPAIAREESPGARASVGHARPASPTARPTQYTLKAGDTLWRVARAHGVTVRALAEANHLTPHQRLRPGLRLSIPSRPA